LNAGHPVHTQPVAVGTETDERAVIVGTPVLTRVGHTASTLVDVCNTQHNVTRILSRKQQHSDENIFTQTGQPFTC
jgi:hypothetical protein